MPPAGEAYRQPSKGDRETKTTAAPSRRFVCVETIGGARSPSNQTPISFPQRLTRADEAMSDIDDDPEYDDWRRRTREQKRNGKQIEVFHARQERR
jgi:hypothetical protein